MAIAKHTITGEAVFGLTDEGGILAFTISESASGYTLQRSLDGGTTWAAISSAIPAAKQHNVMNEPAGALYKLAGNSGSVVVTLNLA